METVKFLYAAWEKICFESIVKSSLLSSCLFISSNQSESGKYAVYFNWTEVL